MTLATTPSEDALHWARPLYERKIDVLGQLAEGGLEMALSVKDRHQDVVQDPKVEIAALEGLARAYGRLARAVRLSLMLQERFIKDLIAFDKGVTPDAGRDDEFKDGIRRIVRIIVDPQADREERERLVSEAAERLDHETLDGAARPVRDLVEANRLDLGLNPDGSLSAAAPESSPSVEGDNLISPASGNPPLPLHGPPSPDGGGFGSGSVPAPP